MKKYKLMQPDFDAYNEDNERLKSYPNRENETFYDFHSVDDVLDSLPEGINSVQSLYGFKSTFPRKELVPAETKYIQKNSESRLLTPEEQEKLNDEIKAMQMCLTPGQVVFHAGTDFLPEDIIEPLSTSFSPTVAYMNAIHNGKAYNAGKLVLYCLTVKNSDLPVYVYQKKGADELEVLFASGINLKNIMIYKEDVIEYGFGLGKSSTDKMEFVIVKAEIC